VVVAGEVLGTEFAMLILLEEESFGRCQSVSGVYPADCGGDSLIITGGLVGMKADTFV
jgi:hypothetical protein